MIHIYTHPSIYIAWTHGVAYGVKHCINRDKKGHFMYNYIV